MKKIQAVTSYRRYSSYAACYATRQRATADWRVSGVKFIEVDTQELELLIKKIKRNNNN